MSAIKFVGERGGCCVVVVVVEGLINNDGCAIRKAGEGSRGEEDRPFEVVVVVVVVVGVGVVVA